MRPVGKFTIIPALPERLARLNDLAYNMWWCWEHEAIDLIRRLDTDLWDAPEVYHNPVKMLNLVPQERLQALAEDEGFVAQYERVIRWLDEYMEAPQKGTTWFAREYPDGTDMTFAYMSAEYGINESFPNYSGGLGVLAGDHLKASSDLGIPLVAIGLLYQMGYFTQYLNNDGWQQEEYPVNDFYSMPLTLVRDDDGQPLIIDVDYPGRSVYAWVWKLQVGRVPLYLLDTNIEENVNPADRDITDQLYGGDLEMRIKQEILLGIGGARVLNALKIDPTVVHMNEGHSAFSALERIRMTMHTCGCSFDEAVEIVRSGTVFTTHTPVPAGNDVFGTDLIDRYFSHYYGALGISRERFLQLGQETSAQSRFGMTPLAIRLSMFTNGVSKLHGKVARSMWKSLFPGLPVDEVPITSITNGVHVRSWISNDMAWLYNRYLGPTWMQKPADGEIWQKVKQIPDEELWRTHCRRRERLVNFSRKRLESQLKRRGATRREITSAGEVLDPDTLTIGFARRFATYKRATLLLRDPARLTKLLLDKERPLQFIFAGKAHPADSPGKEFMRQLVHFMRSSEELRRHLVFIEDYDINVARYMVQGVDVWLNTPRRPLEASGTSGMKATLNGALNCSVLDGWWDEAWIDHGEEDVGWAIGSGEEYTDLEHDLEDDVESRALFNLLEQEIIPTFYERNGLGLPRQWIGRMKASMSNLCAEFNSSRQVSEYTDRFYVPASRRWSEFQGDEHKRAKDLAAWKQRIRQYWGQVHLVNIEHQKAQELPVGADLSVQADVFLGQLTPDDVAVQAYHGRIDAAGEIANGVAVDMTFDVKKDDNVYHYTGTVPATGTGQHGFAIRILPRHADLTNPYEMGLVVWSS